MNTINILIEDKLDGKKYFTGRSPWWRLDPFVITLYYGHIFYHFPCRFYRYIRNKQDMYKIFDWKIDWWYVIGDTIE